MLLFGSLLTLAGAFALGVLFFRSLPLPHIARFGLGAAIESLAVFLLLRVGWAGKWTFLALGCVVSLPLFWLRPKTLREIPPDPLDPFSRYLFAAVLTAYTAIYAIYALAPETQPDAITYHLGLAAEYVRLGHFPSRAGFYEVLPQGLEMLFAMALSWGGLSSAKLVHFAFLLGAIPLLLATGRKLGMSDRASLGAAALYYCMPVAGISGTSAYNDAALVFFTALTFYLLLLWNGDRRWGYLAAAGLASGFCFALKITGLPIATAAVLAAAAVSREWKPAAVIAAAAALSIAPWMLRDLSLTGNPVAPILNAWFPNPYFNTTSEKALSAALRSYGTFRWTTAPVEYALRGGFQGVTGPILFLLPLGFAALRKYAGRWLFPAAFIALLPWFWNAGTRFLMPCLLLLLLAFAVAVPRAVLLFCVVTQAIVCWPPIIRRIEDPYRWTLREVPWRAALRLEPEDAYLRRTVGEYPVARMVEERTGPGDRIFCLATTAKAYTTRELVDCWHSTPAEQLRDGLQLAYSHAGMSRTSAGWPAEPLNALRVIAGSSAPDEWRIFEMRLFSPGGQVYPSPLWSLDANPNRWEASAAFDENRATSWNTRDPVRRGMYLEARLDREQILSGVEILSERAPSHQQIAIEGLARNGAWKRLADAPRIDSAPPDDLRHEAATAVRRAGFHYILAEAGLRGMSLVGADMLKNPAEWGVADSGEAGAIHLFHIQ